MWSFHSKWVVKIEKNMKNEDYWNQTESFNVIEQNPPRKRTEAVTVNEQMIYEWISPDYTEVLNINTTIIFAMLTTQKAFANCSYQ